MNIRQKFRRGATTVAAALAVGALALTGCSGSGAGGSGATGGSADPSDITIGVAMPTKSSERWIKDGEYMKTTLEAAGYKVNLQFANDDIPTQVTQVSDMVTKGNQVLVIGSIDGVALKGALKDAKDPATGEM